MTHAGLVYYASNQASAPATPSASSYSFATGAITGLTSGWSITPPVLNIGQTGKYWSSRWAVEETTSGGGTGTPTFQTAVAQFTFDGVVTFSNSTTLTDGSNSINATSFDAAGAAAAAQAASDAVGSATQARIDAIAAAATDASTKRTEAIAAANLTLSQTLASKVYAPSTTQINGAFIKTGTIQAASIIAGTITGWTINGGTMAIGTGNTPSFKAFEVNAAGAVWTDGIIGGIFSGNNLNRSTASAVTGTTRQAHPALFGQVPSNHASTSAHGIRGTNFYAVGTRVQTSGLIGAANGFDFYAEGAGSNYGPFTGAHDCLVANDETVSIGDLVVDLSCIARRGLSNTLFSVETSSSANQAAVLGVIVANNGFLSDRQPAAFIEEMTKDGIVMSSDYESAKNNYQLMAVNAVGEGQINLVGEAGNLAAGDLIVASSTAGKGMKQADDFVRSYTVARVRESVSFSSPSEEKLVACIYMCG